MKPAAAAARAQSCAGFLPASLGAGTQVCSLPAVSAALHSWNRLTGLCGRVPLASRCRKRASFTRFCFDSDDSRSEEKADAVESEPSPERAESFRTSKDELRTSLATLTEVLTALSMAVAQAQASVDHLSKVIENTDDFDSPVVTKAKERHISTSRPEVPLNGAPVLDLDPTAAEPWDVAEIGGGIPGTRGGGGEPDGSVPAHLVEENARAHKLAYQLQRAFVQARIEGLGKPFQLAMEDFVNTCMEAHAAGLGLNELQLQVILAEGALTGAFSVKSQLFSKDPLLDEERRVRSSWVRLVYATLAEVFELQMGGSVDGPPGEDGQGRESDPSDIFVKQAVKMALEDGYDLERIKLEQSFSDAPDIPKSIKMMRQSQYLVVLTMEKALGQTKESG